MPPTLIGAELERPVRGVMERVMYGGLVLVPVVLAARIAGAPGPLLFVGTVAALVPLAWLIGEATEHAAEHTGSGSAALLNASFGNAPELIITLFAVGRGLDDVVRGSLVGSVAGNLLLVLGTALIAGRRGALSRGDLGRSTALVGLACLVFTITTVTGAGDGGAVPTVIAAAVLMTAYGVTTVRTLRGGGGEPNGGEAPAVEAGWSLRRALAMLGGATLATVAMSEVLTASIESFARALDIPNLFVAGVLVALAGNAAEHGGAVVIAVRGRLELATRIAMTSAAQVGLAVLPAVAVISLVIRPLALTFGTVELACLAATAAVPAIVLRDGYGSRRRGMVLCAVYAAVAIAFLLA